MIKVQTLRLRGLVASSLLALAACSGTSTGPSPQPRESTPDTATTRDRSAATDTGGAQDPQISPLTRRSALLSKALENARQSLDLRLYAEARNEAAFALELDNGNSEARDILNRCNAALGDRAGETPGARLEQAVLIDKIRQERERAVVDREMQLGRANLQQGNFGRAVDHFERAVTTLRYSAYAQANDTQRKEAEKALAEAREAKAQAEADQFERAKTASAQELARLEQEQAIARQLRVERILEQANLSFQAGQYTQSVKLVEQALMLDPTNPTATALRDLADRARHNAAIDTNRERFRTEWNKTFLDLQHSNIPQTESVVFDPARWAVVSQREPANYTQAAELDTLENQAVQKRLEETVLEHNFASATVQDWASYYARLTGATFIISEEVKALPAEQTTLSDFRLPRRSVADALRNIQSQTGVAFNIRDSIVHLVSPEKAIGVLYVEKYHVQDLVQGVYGKPGPNLSLPIPGVDQPLFPEEEDTPAPSVVDEGRLQDLLKSTVASERWDGNPFTMNAQAGVLYVRANADTHQQIERLISELRKHVGIQIDVEARFLKVEDSFLEDVGIDLRGLGNQAAQGLAGRGLEKKGLRPNAGFDDFGPGTNANAATPGLVGTGTEPGVFFDNGRDGDYMARLENLYDGTLGGRRGGLDNAGGLSLQYAFLDDAEIEVVLRAVAKQERSEQIEAPRLMVFNNVRASMHNLRNIAYIRDFDVEIAQAAAVANPVIGVVHEGVALDVRPVVDADLKFITLELRPTVMTLQLPIPQFTTTLGVGQPISIQLPEVNLQKVRTTVTIPDGGTMMLGGMRLVERQNLRSSVPLLGNVPGLSWLFSRRGTSVQNRKILILVKAKIVLMEEQEPESVQTSDGRIITKRK